MISLFRKYGFVIPFIGFVALLSNVSSAQRVSDSDKQMLRQIIDEQRGFVDGEDPSFLQELKQQNLRNREGSSINSREEERITNNQKVLIKAFQESEAHEQGLAQQQPGQIEKRPSDRVDILVSESMGQSTLRVVTETAMECMARSPIPVRLVYRGVADSDTLATFTQRQVGFLNAISEGKKGPVPDVVIDFEPFEDFAPEGMVPVSISYSADGKPVSRPGIIDPCFDSSDPIRGQATQLVAASEKPILSLIKERLAKIDWEQKKKEVIRRYYESLPLSKLPPATQGSKRLISMDVKIIDDIRLPNGDFLAKKGDVINPLTVSPLLGHYLVINPNEPGQIKWAKTYINENPGREVVVMLDGAPITKTPDSFTDIAVQLGADVYLLNDQIASRFHITKTPSVVTQADERNIQVTEVAINEISH